MHLHHAGGIGMYFKAGYLAMHAMEPVANLCLVYHKSHRC